MREEPSTVAGIVVPLVILSIAVSSFRSRGVDDPNTRHEPGDVDWTDILAVVGMSGFGIAWAVIGILSEGSVRIAYLIGAALLFVAAGLAGIYVAAEWRMRSDRSALVFGIPSYLPGNWEGPEFCGPNGRALAKSRGWFTDVAALMAIVAVFVLPTLGSQAVVPGVFFLIFTFNVFRGVEKLEVYNNGLIVGLGPLGLIRRFVPRDEVVLRAGWRYLNIRADTPILGPIRSVRLQGDFPERVLRSIGYTFEPRW